MTHDDFKSFIVSVLAVAKKTTSNLTILLIVNISSTLKLSIELVDLLLHLVAYIDFNLYDS